MLVVCCSVAKSCLTLCDPRDSSTPGFPVFLHLLELAQTHVHSVSDVIPMISSSVVPFSSCLQSFPASGSFPVSQLFASGGQSIGASVSAGLISFRIDWFDLFAVQGTLKGLLQHHSLKAPIISAMINLLYSETLILDAVFSVCNISLGSFSYLPILSPLCLCFSLNPWAYL